MVKIVMEMIASYAFATQPPSDSILRLPLSKQERIVKPVMWKNIIGQAIYQVTILILLLTLGKEWLELLYENSDPLFADQAWLDKNKGMGLSLKVGDATNKCRMYTIVLQTFAMMQVFSMINSRKPQDYELNVFANFCSRISFSILVILDIVILTALIYYGGGFLKTAKLD